MDNFFVQPDEIQEIIKRRYLNKNEEIDLDKISSNEINNFVIKCETDRFNDLFDKVFEENILSNNNNNFDYEDGNINIICLEIVSKIKKSLEKVDKLKLLNFQPVSFSNFDFQKRSYHLFSAVNAF